MGPVFPIPIAFTKSSKVDLHAISEYVRFLENNGAETILTTSGTSQFNLLSPEEILNINCLIYKIFSKRAIVGIPAMSEYHLKSYLEKTYRKCPNCTILLTYPERFYNSSDLISYFESVNQIVESKFYIHGLPIKSGRQGYVSYTAPLVNEIRNACDKFCGMKEESPTYEEGFIFCSQLVNLKDFEVIVAGGSMRRFLLLHAAGAQSFLTGIGSLYPKIEIAFYNHLINKNISDSVELIEQFETPFFEVFMKIGWHKSLRYAAYVLNLLPGEQRKPMELPTKNEREEIETILKKIKKDIPYFTKKNTI